MRSPQMPLFKKMDEMIVAHLNLSLNSATALIQAYLKTSPPSRELSAILEDVGNKYIDLSEALGQFGMRGPATLQEPERSDD